MGQHVDHHDSMGNGLSLQYAIIYFGSFARWVSNHNRRRYGEDTSRGSAGSTLYLSSLC